MSFNLENLVRENIKRLTPYSSARKEFTGAARIFLDANENSFGSPLPEKLQSLSRSFAMEIKGKNCGNKSGKTVGNFYRKRFGRSD